MGLSCLKVFLLLLSILVIFNASCGALELNESTELTGRKHKKHKKKHLKVIAKPKKHILKRKGSGGKGKPKKVAVAKSSDKDTGGGANNASGCGTIADIRRVRFNHNPTNIPLKGFNAPLIFPLTTFRGPHPSLVRVDDVKKNGFKTYLSEPYTYDGPHMMEDTDFLIVEKGKFEIGDGAAKSQVVTGTVDAKAGATVDVQFGTTFSKDPVVLVQTQDASSPRWQSARIISQDTKGFKFVLDDANPAKGSPDKRVKENKPTTIVGWAAFEQGSGKWEGIGYKIDKQDFTSSSFKMDLNKPLKYLVASLSGAEGQYEHLRRKDGDTLSSQLVNGKPGSSKKVSINYVSFDKESGALKGCAAGAAKSSTPVKKAPTPPKSDNKCPAIADIRRVRFSHRPVSISVKGFTSPVVFPLTTFRGPHPSLVRVDDVKKDAFKTYLSEPYTYDGPHMLEDTDFLIVEKGKFDIGDGSSKSQVIVGTVDAKAGATVDVQFGKTFSKDPVVLVQTQDVSSPRWQSARIISQDTKGFKFVLDDANPAKGSPDKRVKENKPTTIVGWAAFEQGSGKWEGIGYKIDKQDFTSSSFKMQLNKPLKYLVASLSGAEGQYEHIRRKKADLLSAQLVNGKPGSSKKVSINYVSFDGESGALKGCASADKTPIPPPKALPAPPKPAPPKPAEPKDNIVFTCDNNAVVYVNGKRQGVSKAWTKHTVIKNPAFRKKTERNVIAAFLRNTGGPAGFIARIAMDGEYEVTDKDWMCTDKKPKAGWEDPDFEEDGEWKPAVEIAALGQGVWGTRSSAGKAMGLDKNVKWIWTDDWNDKGDRNIWCRFTLTEGPPKPKPLPPPLPSGDYIVYTADNVATIFVNGAKKGTINNWTKHQVIDKPDFAKKSEANVVAAELVNAGGPAGFIARIGFAGKVVTTNKNWRCTDKRPAAGWEKADYDEDDAWKPATEIVALGGGVWGSRTSAFKAMNSDKNVKWIWSDGWKNKGDRNVWCRLLLSEGPPKPKPKPAPPLPPPAPTGDHIVFTADNEATIYVNGAQKGSNKDWSKHVVVDKPAFGKKTDRNVVAAALVNAGGPAGFIARISFEDSFYTTDKEWLCTDSKPADGWEKPDFNTDESWKAATEIATLGEGIWGTRSTAMTAMNSDKNVKWIWTSDWNDKGDRNVWCRVILTPGPPKPPPVIKPKGDHIVTAADNKADIYVNGVKKGSNSAWDKHTTIENPGFGKPADRNVVAAELENSGGPAGFIARIHFAGDVYTTDNQWKCTDKKPGANWAQPDFETDQTWVPATEVAALGDGVWGKRSSAVKAMEGDKKVKWIWTSDFNDAGDRNVWCRVVLTAGPPKPKPKPPAEPPVAPLPTGDYLMFEGDNAAEVFINGVPKAVGKNWDKEETVKDPGFNKPEERNVLAAKLTNSGGPGGFIARIRFAGKTYTTDKQWKCTDQNPGNDWAKPDFEPDDSWEQATEIAPLGSGPWATKVHGVKAMESDKNVKWIWTSDWNDKGDRAIWCRVVLSEGPPKPKAGPKGDFIMFEADNSAVVYVNGAKKGEGKNWDKHETISEPGFGKKTERNVVAVELENTGGPAGFVARMKLGEDIFVSDKQWKCTDKKPAKGWETTGFEQDETWEPATEIATLGEGPWSDKVSAAKAFEGDKNVKWIWTADWDDTGDRAVWCRVILSEGPPKPKPQPPAPKPVPPPPRGDYVMFEADNDAVVWVNGVKKGESHEWDKHETIETPGFGKVTERNVIAVQLANTGGPAGFCARISFDGDFYATDKQWQCTDKKPVEGWETTDFQGDDSWEPATEIDTLGEGVWGTKPSAVKAMGGDKRVKWIWTSDWNDKGDRNVWCRVVLSEGPPKPKQPTSDFIMFEADNSAVVYVNGAKKGEGKHWDKHETISEPGFGKKTERNVVAVELENTGGPAGFVARMKLGEDIFVSDKQWSCTDKEPAKGWEGVDFKPDQAWGPAHEIASLGEGVWGTKVSAFTAMESDKNVKWIWTADWNDKGDRKVWCRVILTEGKVDEPKPQGDYIVFEADNSAVVYVNGAKKGEGKNWDKHETISEPGFGKKTERNVVAVELQNTGGPAGFVARIGFGGSVFTSDKQWQCVDKQPGDGWEKPDFDDDSWPAATEIATLGEGVWGTKPSAVTAMEGDKNVKWIWTSDWDDKGDRKVWCRVTLSEGEEVDKGDEILFEADNSAVVYVNGAKKGEGKNWDKHETISEPGFGKKTERNVVAVELQNTGGPAGFVARITLDGDVYVTDKQWQCTDDAPPAGWEKPNFEEDDSWDDATEIATLGEGVWGTKVSAFTAMESDKNVKWIWTEDWDDKGDRKVWCRITLTDSAAAPAPPAAPCKAPTNSLLARLKNKRDKAIADSDEVNKHLAAAQSQTAQLQKEIGALCGEVNSMKQQAVSIHEVAAAASAAGNPQSAELEASAIKYDNAILQKIGQMKSLKMQRANATRQAESLANEQAHMLKIAKLADEETKMVPPNVNDEGYSMAFDAIDKAIVASDDIQRASEMVVKAANDLQRPAACSSCSSLAVPEEAAPASLPSSPPTPFPKATMPPTPPKAD